VLAKAGDLGRLAADAGRATEEAEVAADAERAAEETESITSHVESETSCPALGGLSANSFTPDTLVATPSGQRAIGSLVVGDTVLAEDPVSGKVEPEPITALHRNDDPLTGIVVIGGETIHTTPEHPFYTTEHGWVDAKDLVPGEHVRSQSGGSGLVERVGFAPFRQFMDNLTVAVDHDYFVGAGAWLVHNCGERLSSSTPRNPDGTFAKGGPGETADTAAGRAAHDNYSTALGDDYLYNKAIPDGSGLRPDAVDFEHRIVRELKPDSPRAIAGGQRQIDRYISALESLPGETKGSWQGFVDVYRTFRTPGKF